MQGFINALKARHSPLEMPYLQALRDGRLTRDGFVRTQLQFHSAVVAFPRGMETLARRVDPMARTVLLANVQDELGNGDPSRSHDSTFRELLARFDVPRAAIDGRSDGPEVSVFNLSLRAACEGEPPPFALAALGMIEDLFAGIAGAIGRGIVMRGWLAESDVVHYPTHERIDLEHAEAFYSLVRSQGDSADVQRGLAFGAHAFLGLYDDLLDSVSG